MSTFSGLKANATRPYADAQSETRSNRLKSLARRNNQECTIHDHIRKKIYHQQSEEPSPAWKTLKAKCNTKDEFGRQVRQAYVESEAESETVQILPAQRRAAGGNAPQSCNRDTEIAQTSTTE